MHCSPSRNDSRRSRTRHSWTTSRKIRTIRGDLPLIRIGQGFTLSLDVLERVDRMAAILVLNGPNLNLLGSREPGHYGRTTLAEIQQDLEESARSLGCTLECLQSNAEHVLIEAVHRAPEQGVRFIILNPAAFTHTSVALRDALLAVGIPFIEVHLSNVHAREPFRAHSYFSDIAIGVISGLGAEGYLFALRAAAGRLAPDHSNENH
jgi:3-dehydroquinate dehydratase II